MKPVLDVLIAGRELISDPSRWTQGYFARDSAGEGMLSSDPAAVCWCSVGALAKVAPTEWDGLYFDEPIDALGYRALVKALPRRKRHLGAASFNDTHTHSEVLALWDRAIEAEKAKACT